MLFNSFHYFLFLVVVLLLIDTVRKREYQHTLLLVASYYFYWAFSSIYVLLLVFSTLLDFYCGRAIYLAPIKRKKRLFLIASLVSSCDRRYQVWRS